MTARCRNAGVEHFCHPVVGDLHLTYDPTRSHGVARPDAVRLRSRAGSRSGETLKLLGSWAATVDPIEATRATDKSWGGAR